MKASMLVTAMLIVGCKEPARTAPARPQSPSIFDDSYSFRCSADKAVGCSGVFPPRDGSQAAVLWGGEEAFRARVASLRQARRSIRIQALIFRGDDAGLLIADLLKQKKREGLDIRIIVDALSNLAWQTQWMYFDLKRSGIEVEGYEALYLQWLTAEVQPTDPLRPNKRFHDKMWIVDAEDPGGGLAIVGGLNIANEYFRLDPQPVHRWHDQDVMLKGAIVRDVTATFDRNYDFFKGLKQKLTTPADPDNAWRLARATMDQVAKTDVPYWKSPIVGQTITTTLARPAALELVPLRARFLQSRPRLKESYIEQTYLELIARARRQILIANAYFIPSRPMIDGLRRAAQRGVRVVILTNSPETNDISSVALVSRHIYLDLIGGGDRIEIYEWAGAPFKEGTLHAKYGVFDDESVIVGSFNLDPRSARLNSETAVALSHRGIGQKLGRHFLEHNLPRARRVSVEQARNFRHPERAGEAFKLLFALPIKSWL